MVLTASAVVALGLGLPACLPTPAAFVVVRGWGPRDTGLSPIFTGMAVPAILVALLAGQGANQNKGVCACACSCAGARVRARVCVCAFTCLCVGRGVMRYDVLCCDVVSYDMIWHDMTWYDAL